MRTTNILHLYIYYYVYTHLTAIGWKTKQGEYFKCNQPQWIIIIVKVVSVVVVIGLVLLVLYRYVVSATSIRHGNTQGGTGVG